MRFTLLLLVIVSATTNAVETLPDGFRGAHWGDGLSAIVISAPDQEVSRTKASITGQCQLAERPFWFVYSGTNGKLDQGAYIHDERHIDSNVDVAIFDSLISILTAKYGPPTSSQELWSNELFKGERSKLGTALAVEAVVLRAQWTTATSYLMLQAKGKNVAITVTLTYGRLSDLSAGALKADAGTDRTKL